MSGKRVLDYDPLTGIIEWFIPTDDGFRVAYEQDCEPIIELNKQKKSLGRAYYAQDNEMWRVASIPVIVQMKWMTEKGVDIMNKDHWPAVKRLLNDPEWCHLKMAEIVI